MADCGFSIKLSKCSGVADAGSCDGSCSIAPFQIRFLRGEDKGTHHLTHEELKELHSALSAWLLGKPVSKESDTFVHWAYHGDNWREFYKEMKEMWPTNGAA